MRAQTLRSRQSSLNWRRKRRTSHGSEQDSEAEPVLSLEGVEAWWETTGKGRKARQVAAAIARRKEADREEGRREQDEEREEDGGV